MVEATRTESIDEDPSPPTSNTSNESSAPVAWSATDAAELYGVNTWGKGFFGICDRGEAVVNLTENGQPVALSLLDIVEGIRDRGMEAPLLLRFQDLLAARIGGLNAAFAEAIKRNAYRGKYRGVYPIKVNQQHQVVEQVTRVGRQYHYGLEAGSKPELLAALAYMHDPEAYIVCNGYKDREFIDLALSALKLGIQTVLVIEMPGELDLIMERAEELNVSPILGVRVKLATRNDGRWSRSSGERSVFGLTADQVMEVVESLRRRDRLDCLRLLHYHQGSQVPDIRAIRDASMEAARIYVELAREGATMGLIDIGGGLAIDYDGSRSNTPSSRNYGMLEYATDVVEIIMTVCDEAGQPHPDIVSESGRAVAAYYSVLIFNILEVNRFTSHMHTLPLPENSHAFVKHLREVDEVLNDKNIQECYNDAVYYRGELLSLFNHGRISLRERAYADSLFYHLVSRMLGRLEHLEQAPTELETLEQDLQDVYYGNFSLFQSLPDTWAIDQLFPVMPIHRLNEKPTCSAILADITCDCDGRMDDFLVAGERRRSLPLHALKNGDEYLLGVFLVGAYQETLGDLHNLLGDTNVVNVGVKDGRPQYLSELRGDSVADVLSYVEYDPKQLVERFRKLAEDAVQAGRISAQERRTMLADYEDSIRGYTYFEP
ncbi:MAG: biosynthetic arginine decarboxylase [Planctomycetales bacterium]|nr:biosynthetic arginine decarboxylase [Planctomycetales bacterium]